jgi:hypothetical protein
MRRSIAVERDRLRDARLGLHRFAEEGFGGGYVTPRAQPEVDCPARSIDGTIEIAPLASDFDVCFVNTPRPTNCKGISAPALLELRCVVLDPSHDGGMCQRQTTLGHHLGQVSQAQFEPKVPAHAQNNDLAVEVSAREQLLQALQLLHCRHLPVPGTSIAEGSISFAPEPLISPKYRTWRCTTWPPATRLFPTTLQ